MNKKNIKGQALVEILVVILIISLTMVGILGLANRSVTTSDAARTQTEANRATAELLEWLRAERDMGWNAFLGRARPFASGQDWCMNDLSWTNQRACNNNDGIPDTNLIRQVNLSSSGGNRVLVKVTITWTDETGSHRAYTEYVLGDWR